VKEKVDQKKREKEIKDIATRRKKWTAGEFLLVV